MSPAERRRILEETKLARNERDRLLEWIDSWNTDAVREANAMLDLLADTVLEHLRDLASRAHTAEARLAHREEDLDVTGYA